MATHFKGDRVSPGRLLNKQINKTVTTVFGEWGGGGTEPRVATIYYLKCPI